MVKCYYCGKEFYTWNQLAGHILASQKDLRHKNSQRWKKKNWAARYMTKKFGFDFEKYIIPPS